MQSVNSKKAHPPRCLVARSFALAVTGALLFASIARAQDPAIPATGLAAPVLAPALSAVLPPEKWQALEHGVDHALVWIASQQENDGSFPTYISGQPAVTSFCVMAFLSRGYRPGAGPYGAQLNRAIDYVLSCQKPDGLLCLQPPQEEWIRKEASHSASYNHAIAGLMLGEVYGHVTGPRARAVKQAIQKALKFTRDLQLRPKENSVDNGGWRYVRVKPGEFDSDLSVTAWQLMFLRSAKNAEFAVPQQYVDDAVSYVRRCWDPERRCFSYARVGGSYFMQGGRAMAGAGILSLSLAGQHQTRLAQAAGDWLLAHPYVRRADATEGWDRYFYSTYYCSQAAMQLGGRYWEGIFPPLVDSLLQAQQADGSWPREMSYGDAMFGNIYTTALAVLALTPPFQLLPVYQK
jgi:hypothetical protein